MAGGIPGTGPRGSTSRCSDGWCLMAQGGLYSRKNRSKTRDPKVKRYKRQRAVVDAESIEFRPKDDLSKIVENNAKPIVHNFGDGKVENSTRYDLTPKSSALPVSGYRVSSKDVSSKKGKKAEGKKPMDKSNRERHTGDMGMKGIRKGMGSFAQGMGRVDDYGRQRQRKPTKINISM